MIPGTAYISDIEEQLDTYMITESVYLRAVSLLAEYDANHRNGGEMEYPVKAAEIVKQYEQGER